MRLFNAPAPRDLRNIAGLHDPACPGRTVPVSAVMAAGAPSGDSEGTLGHPSGLSLHSFEAAMVASRLHLISPKGHPAATPSSPPTPFLLLSDMSVKGHLTGAPGMISVACHSDILPVNASATSLEPVLALTLGLRRAVGHRALS